jgi:hypothetical protein
MTGARETFVHEADLQLDDGTDPAAAGAAVTTALCGHWEHEGPCRWPHNNEIDASGSPATFRTLFVATAADEDHVRSTIRRALAEGPGWAVLVTRARPVSRREMPLAARLAATPAA